MQLNDLKKNSPRKITKRVGRGRSRGKTSGRGMKGQKARAGTSGRPVFRDIINKIPKLRGHGIHGNRNKAIIKKYIPVNLSVLEENFSAGDVINRESLLEKNIIKKKKGKFPLIKILGNGDISKKVEINSLSVSKTAQDKIEKAGGKITE